MPRRLAPIPADKAEYISSIYDKVRSSLMDDIHAGLQGHIRSTELAKIKRLTDKLDDVIGLALQRNPTTIATQAESTEDMDVEAE